MIFKNFSEYIFYITLIAFYLVRNKLSKRYQILPARYEHSKVFENFP